MDWATVEETSGLVMAVVGTVVLLSGFILLLLKQTDAYGVIGAGLGFIAGGLGFVADTGIREMRRSEVDEKLAVISSYVRHDMGAVLSNLKALERNAHHASKQQACQIASEGKSLVDALKKANLPTEAEDAEKILTRILKRHHLTL